MFDFYRKEQEEENERLRPFMTWVKYTLGLKHQVSKQRGEEYRAHGQNGWLWLSSTRRFTPQDANKMGLRAGNIRDKYFPRKSKLFRNRLKKSKLFPI